MPVIPASVCSRTQVQFGLSSPDTEIAAEAHGLDLGDLHGAHRRGRAGSSAAHQKTPARQRRLMHGVLRS